MAASSFSSMPEGVCEGIEFSYETNKILLMALMEETQDDHQYCAHDDRLISMIQSLEAEISSTTGSGDSYQSYDMEVGQVDDQDCSTSSSILFNADDWDDMEVVSASSSFDEETMMSAWSLCAAGGDDSTADYYNSSESYYGGLLENYLPQEATDHVVF
ncbi:hypothetical protein QN277_008932 [Acacia crassicarpa]|uniref:Uncharacterized protein n=1 Tax=Acacia crassicarpa TaxID=499986 RepID=A0AAE1IRA1_9FABA|nr:hypothetical protein QN277_008932 [Acacia crassicarpa]